MDAHVDASKFSDGSVHAVRCCHQFRPHRLRRFICRGPVWRYTDRGQIGYASSKALRLKLVFPVGNLSRTWEDSLEVVREREGQLAAARSHVQHQQPISRQRAAYLALGADLERAWNHEKATTGMRKHILRAVLVETIVTASADRINLVLHWQGGDHTELSVGRRKSGQTRMTTDADTGDMIRELARLIPDRAITAFLNRVGK